MQRNRKNVDPKGVWISENAKEQKNVDPKRGWIYEIAMEQQKRRSK
ncbi:hypothetical protein [Lederbergia ruris]|nr:hypothetical protein [Lederbergia ruris]